VGDILVLNRNDRVPADCILLWTNDPAGTTFIRTDQLDGETDWKLRKSCDYTLNAINKRKLDLQNIDMPYIECEKPRRELYDFIGRLIIDNDREEGISLENTLWSNTVLACGKAYVLVI